MNAVTFNEIDKALIELVDKKMQLNQLNYSDENYDLVEDELHDLEDDFIDEYGEILEEILEDIHEKCCPESDVLLPIAYLAQHYLTNGQVRNGKPVYDVRDGDGVLIESKKYPSKEARLVIVPNPLRIVLAIAGFKKEVVWQAEGLV